MPSTLQLKVFLTGRVTVETDGAVIDEARLGGRQGRLVFAYLVAEQGRAVPRDELAEALWGETPPATRDKALTVLVSKLRGALVDAGLDRGGLLTAAFGCYRLDLPEGTWVDLFEAASDVTKAERALAAGDLERARSAAASAESLAGRPFLPGEEGTWAEDRRRGLADVRERALDVLADACLRAGAAREASKWAEELIALAPFRETGYRRLMEAHVAAGDRAEALRVYERCRRLLADELGAYPSPEIESMYRGLLEVQPVEPARSHQPALDAPVVRDGAPRPRRRRLAVALAGGVAAAATVVAVVVLPGEGSRSAAAAISANSVGAVSTSTGRIVGSIPLGGAPSDVTSGGGSLWVSMSDRNSVSRIDPATSTIQQTIGVGSGPAGLAFGGGFVWVANSLAGTVTQIDPLANGGQAVATIPVGNGPNDIAYGAGAVWVANTLDRTVTRVDPVTGTTSPPIAVAVGADAIAAGRGAVWVTSESAGVLSRIDPATHAVTQRINVGNAPVAVAVGPSGVWVANDQDGTVSRIDSATGRPEGLIRVGAGPNGVSFAANGSVWVSNGLSGTLSRINAKTGRVVATTRIGALPQAVALAGDRAFVAAQGASGAHRGGTLRLVISNPPGVYSSPIPQSLDPGFGYPASELLTLTNDGLLAYGRSGGAAGYRVVPDLAARMPTIGDGRRSYTFQLRRGIRWSTGALVRPADVRRGIERALAASGGNLPGAYLAGLVGGKGCVTRPKQCDLSRGVVTRAGSSTITFHLTAPDPDFLYRLALPTFDAVPARTPLTATLPLPATGPYRIASFSAKPGAITLVRNQRFRVWSAAAQPGGYPDQIIERYSYTAAAAVRAVERGGADITTDGPDQTWSPGLAAMLQTRYSSRLYTEPLLVTLGLWMNTRLAPFDDVRVRRALNYAVDRNHLVDVNGGSIEARVDCQFLPPNIDGYRPYCPYTAAPTARGTYSGPNMAKARRLVAASGTRGQRVTVWFYDIPVGRQNGAYFVTVLRSLGYRAVLKTVAHDGQPTWRSGRQAGVSGWGADYPSSGNLLSTQFSCASYTTSEKTNANAAGFCDKRIDRQIARATALQSQDPNAASHVWATIDRELTDAAPWVPMKSNLSADFVSRRTGNYKYCWLSGQTGVVSACLDQLWVR
jgi:peptide/nickel transport system substrate-binding protein